MQHRPIPRLFERQTSSSSSIVMRICGTEATCPMDSPGDPDIAGIGIVLSFLLTSIITLIAVIAGYFKGFLHPDRYRPADREFIRSCKALFNPTVRNQPAITIRPSSHIDVFEGFILSFSDQQLVTGLAILIALYSKSCDISVFSFQVAVSLAFFAFMLHLCTLAVLRTYLHKNKLVRNIRLAAVLLFGIFMVVSLVLSHSASFYKRPDWQVRCAVEDFKFTISPQVVWIQYGNAALVVWFIVSSYGTGLAEVFDTEFCKFLGSWYFWIAFRVGNKRFEEDCEFRAKKRAERWDRAAKNWEANRHSRAKLGILVFAIQETARSFVWKIVWMLFYFTFALTNFLMKWLQSGYYKEGLTVWGFGQIVPMLFLIIPILNVIEVISNLDRGAKRKIEKARAKIERDRLKIEKLESKLERLEAEAGVHSHEKSMSGDTKILNPSPSEPDVIRRTPSPNPGPALSQQGEDLEKASLYHTNAKEVENSRTTLDEVTAEETQGNHDSEETKRFWGSTSDSSLEKPWQVRLLRDMVCASVIPYALVLQFYALLVAGLFSVLRLERTHFLIETIALGAGYATAGAHFFLSVLTGILLRFRGIHVL